MRLVYVKYLHVKSLFHVKGCARKLTRKLLLPCFLLFCLQDEELADVEGIANGSGFKARLLGAAEKTSFCTM